MTIMSKKFNFCVMTIMTIKINFFNFRPTSTKTRIVLIQLLLLHILLTIITKSYLTIISFPQSVCTEEGIHLPWFYILKMLTVKRAVIIEVRGDVFSIWT